MSTPDHILKNYYLTDINLFLKLAVPLILTGLIEASVVFFSNIFLAHLGPLELAAGALVSWLFATLMCIMWGGLSSASVFVALKLGEKDNQGIAFVLRDALFIALMFMVPAALLLWYAPPILLFFGQDPLSVSLATKYLHALVWAVPPDFTTLVLFQFLIGLGQTRTVLVFTLLWVPLNIFCNYAFVFGRFHFPNLDIAGIGWGTSLAYWITLIGMVIYLFARPYYRNFLKMIKPFHRPYFYSDLLLVGIPMGAMYLIEISFLFILTLLMGRMGNEILAANQIALQFGGLVFMVLFSAAQGLAARMGHLLGADDYQAAERATYIGVSIMFILIFISALCYWFLPYQLIGWDLNVNNPNNAKIISYAKSFLAVSAVFQLLESIRVMLFGSLCALKDTRFTLIISILSFWCIALPLGYFFSTYGATGFWYGIVIGSTFSSSVLIWRFRFRMKQLRRNA